MPYPHSDDQCRWDSIDAEGFREASRQFARIAEALGLPDTGHGFSDIADRVVAEIASHR